METQKKGVEINETLLKQLFDLHIDSLTQFLSYYTRNQQLIEDVIQDVFIKLWEDRDSLNIFHIKTYLYKSARNLLLNNLRDQKNRDLLLENWANEVIQESETEECINMQEFHNLYNEAVDLLPPKCKEIYLLSREKEHTYKEISKLCDISEKTVEGQISIALKKIKHYVLHNYKFHSVIQTIITTYALNKFA